MRLKGYVQPNEVRIRAESHVRLCNCLAPCNCASMHVFCACPFHLQAGEERKLESRRGIRGTPSDIRPVTEARVTGRSERRCGCQESLGARCVSKPLHPY